MGQGEATRTCTAHVHEMGFDVVVAFAARRLDPNDQKLGQGEAMCAAHVHAMGFDVAAAFAAQHLGPNDQKP